MWRSLRSTLREILPEATRLWLGKGQDRLLIRCLHRALREQGLLEMHARLLQIVPDIRQQYSSFALDTEYLNLKVRGMHAFQISLVQRALSLLKIEASSQFTVVDVGDSSGTHVQYIRSLYENSRSLSVNLDREVVERIRRKGLEALHARAEDVALLGLTPDIFLSFQTLEHLVSPISFLRSLSAGAPCRALVVTVPYLGRSRVGLDYIRASERTGASPERVHVFELSREDWILIFQFSGWRVLHDQTYLQYPRRGPLRPMKAYWKATDFEGFYGAILGQDDSWSKLYGWPEVH